MTQSPRELVTRLSVARILLFRAAAGLFTLAFLAAAPSRGDEGGKPLRLTVAEALRVAEAEDEETAIAASKILVSASDIRVARSARLPQVDAQLQYMRTIRTPFAMPSIPGVDIIFPFGNANTWNGGFDFSQLLYDGGRAWGSQRIAEEEHQATRLDAVETTASVRVAVVEAYFGAVLAERQAQIAILTAEQLTRQLETVELRRKAGEASDLDVFRANVEKENVEPQRIAALNDRDLALGHLRQLLNLPAGRPLVLEDDLAAARVRPLPREKLDAIRGSAPKRSNLEASLHLVSSREYDAKNAQAAFLPTVKLSAHFGAYAFPVPVFPSGSNFMDDWSVTVNASVSVFDWGKRQAKVVASEERARQARLSRTQLQQTVDTEVAQRSAELERTEALIAARVRTTRQAEMVYELTELKFKSGVASSLDLTDARTSLRQARQNEAQAVHDYLVALARLQRAAGVPVSLQAVLAPAPVPGPLTGRDQQ